MTAETKEVSKLAVPAWLLASVPLVATFVPKAMVILLALVALPSLYQAWRQQRLSDVFPKAALTVAGFAFIWLSYRAMFPFDGQQSGVELLKYVVLVVLGFGAVWWCRNLKDSDRAAGAKALIFGALVAVSGIYVLGFAISMGWDDWMGIERSDKLSIFNTGLIVVTVLTPILVLFVQRLWNKAWALIFAALVMGATILIGSTTATGALLIGLVVAFFVHKLGRQAVQLIAVLCVSVVVVFPVVVPLVMDRIDVALEGDSKQKEIGDSVDFLGSLGHRYYIWRFALEKARERPLIGWGFDTSRDVPGGHENVGWGKELMPLHPHNAVLQVWLELGVPGLLLLGAVVWLLLRPPPEERRFINGGLLARTTLLVMLLAVMNATFGFWQSWWVASLAMILAVTFLCEKRADQS